MADEKVIYELSLKDLLSDKIKDADNATHKFETSMGSLNETVKKVGETIIAAFAVEKMAEFGKEILHTTALFEGFENRIKFSSDDIQDGAKNMQFLQGIVKDLNLPIEEVYEGFSDMQAGMMGTEIHGDKLRELFKGISTAAASIHLPKEQLERSLYDLKEIGEVGLQGRMVRSLQMQFTGINAVVKQTFGKTMKELEEAGMSGTEFLSKLGKGLQEYYGSGIQNWNESLQAAINKTDNNFIELRRRMGEDLKPVFISVMQTVISFTDKMKEMWDWAVRNKDVLLPLGSALLGAAVAVGTLTLATNAWTAAQWLLNIALEANPIGLVVGAIGALVGAIIYAWKHFVGFRAVVMGVWGVLKEFGALMKDYYTGLYHMMHGMFTFNLTEIKSGLNQAVGVFADGGKRIAQAYKQGYDAEMADFAKQQAGVKAGATAPIKKGVPVITPPEKDISPKRATGQKITTINVTIGNLIDKFNINTTTIQEGSSKVRELVAQTLLSAVNDSEIVAGM